MDDKWFAYFKDERLYLHRSWTGFCIYVVRFEKLGIRYVAREVVVNRNPKQYGQTDNSRDAGLVFEIINLVLLAPRNRRPPVRFVVKK